jgi:hypothetical protein
MTASTWSLPTEPPDDCTNCGRRLKLDGSCKCWEGFDCVCEVTEEPKEVQSEDQNNEG